MHEMGYQSELADLDQVYFDVRPFRHYALTYQSFRPIHFVSGMLMFSVGLLLLSMSVMTPTSMSPEVYGAWAYGYPAELWAMLWMAGGLLVMIAVNKNGDWPFSSLIKALGHLAIAALFALIGGSAMFALYGSAVYGFAFVVFCPVYGFLTFVALKEHRERRRRWNG